MLLALTEYLSQYVSSFGVFQYLTFRTMVGTVTALGLSLLLGPLMIRKLSERQLGQVVRSDGPETHSVAEGIQLEPGTSRRDKGDPAGVWVSNCVQAC